MDQPDFRALCAELLAALETEGYAHWTINPSKDPLVKRARTALATPPPELSEAKGIAEWLYERGRLQDLGTRDWYFHASDLLKQLAAVKATPPPEPPTDEELVAFLYMVDPDDELSDLAMARAALERWGK